MTITPEQLFQPRLPARLSARIHHRVLDRELSAGANPAECPQWAARAAELTTRASRRRVADALEQLAHFPDEHHRVRVGPHPVAVRANRDRFARLVDLLRDETPVYVGGLARLQVALSDGAGPVYTDRQGRALALELERVQAALRG